ncbi:MAG: hypothetical protein HC902_04525 [Calothrix sp. SM1_5_4]|nr:hypothetical protein [Calothrix sp. SM1_5_4]
MIHKACFAIAVLLILAGCQMQPTRVSESQKRDWDVLLDKTRKPLVLTDETVVLDTRSAFDFGLNRVRGALHFPWEDLAETSRTGELPRDPRKAAQRLALLGLKPSTPVVVVGRGRAGQGEEGRLAWALLYYGFGDVQVAGMDALRAFWTQSPSPPPKNAEPWEAKLKRDLLVTRAEFEALAGTPKQRLEKRVWLLDTRSEKEYFQPRGGPDIGAMHVEWKEFYTVQGGLIRPYAINSGRSGCGLTTASYVSAVAGYEPRVPPIRSWL